MEPMTMSIAPSNSQEIELLNLIREYRHRAGLDALESLRERLEGEAVDQGHFLAIVRGVVGNLPTLH
jgi:hypothetical protein